MRSFPRSIKSVAHLWTRLLLVGTSLTCRKTLAGMVDLAKKRFGHAEKRATDKLGGFSMETVANDLRDRVAVITGGARGMGRAYARAFLSAGAKVVATDRSWSGVDEFREELKGHDQNVLVADLDVTEDAQIDQTYQATLDKFKTVDILVNNAAMRSRDLYPPKGRATTLETKDSDWERLFKVNVF